VVDAVHFSSKNINWTTPQAFFDALNFIFNFTLDPTATHENAKTSRYFTKDDDCLKHSWKGERCFMNPPFNKPEAACKKNCKNKRCEERGYHNEHYVPGLIDFVRKAYEESLQDDTLVVCLVPARTDTAAWHRYCKKGYRYEIEGRLKFGKAKAGAPFPTAIVVFGRFFSR
jgi:phage N-6-adenine-methyltransferase